MSPHEAAAVLWEAVMGGMGTFNDTKVTVTWFDGTVIELGDYGELQRAVQTLAEHHRVLIPADEFLAGLDG